MEKEPSMDSKTGPSASMSPSPPSVIGAPRAGTATSSTPRVATPAAGPALPWDVSEEDEYDMNKDEAGPAQKSHKRKLGSSVSPKATAKRGRVMVNDEMHINIVVIGHVDSGNSDTDKLGVVNGKLVTSKYCCSIIDDPKQADCAIFIIDSATSVSTISKDELIEHSLRAFALGRKQMICCCNKMEAPLSKIHYDEFVKEASLYLSSLGFNPHKISFVPISISKGHNVIERSKNLQWYEGPTLHEAINQITGPKRPAWGLSHKDQLQAFSIKKYKNYPVYITRSEGEPGDSKFWSTVEVDGQHFKSVDLHARKKEAEQDAAKVAYEFLMARDGDNFADVLSLVDKGLLLFKVILNEFAEMKKIRLPSYSFHHQKGLGRMTFTVATVSVAGMEFIGEMGKSKKDAKEKAARLAVESILATNDEFMLKIFRSERRVINAAANSLDNKDVVPNSSGVLSDPLSKPSMKPTMETSDQDSEAAPGLASANF